ncbi:MAG TPA: [LysW]-aminoadipate kinase [Phycisphaerales bacterium]|nr:[LysW]-aminoadipate kinase [Phycisphaerales bacterium]
MSTTQDILVVKLGGSAGNDIAAFCNDVAEFVRAGRRLVVVHGGSDWTNRLSEQLGAPPEFITSPSGHTSRRTDRRTLEIMQMACRGGLNQAVVEKLQAAGVNAIGLSGMDGRTWVGERKEAVRSVENGRTRIIRDDFTGTVEDVNVELLRTLLGAGYTPVLCPPGLSRGNEPINVDADRAAARTAAAIGASELLLLSNVAGLMRAFPDESTLIPRIQRGAIDEAMGFAEGRMKKKVLGAGEALEGGVTRVVIGDARSERPIAAALAGKGTVFE